MKKIERKFKMEKATKNTIRFQESTPNENIDDGAQLGTCNWSVIYSKRSIKIS